MPEHAHVTSVAAIEEFRANLVVYVSKARPTLEEVHADVLRLRVWLEQDQRRILEGLLNRRGKELEQAQSSLSTARMSIFRGDCSSEQMAVRQARRAVEDAEGKLKRLKLWSREFDNRVEPLAKQLEKLHTVLTHDMGNAIAYLSQTIQTLLNYANVPAPALAPVEGARAAEETSDAAASAVPGETEEQKPPGEAGPGGGA